SRGSRPPRARTTTTRCAKPRSPPCWLARPRSKRSIVSPRSIERLIRRHTRRVHVYFGARRVTADLLAGWRHPQLLFGVSRSIDESGGLDAAIAALVEALRALRAEAGDLTGLACEVVLADNWIVYDVVSIDLLRVSSRSADAAIAATLEDV